VTCVRIAWPNPNILQCSTLTHPRAFRASYSGAMRSESTPLQQATSGRHLAAQLPAIDENGVATRAFEQSIGFFVADRESDCPWDEVEFDNDRHEGWF
jgi:hypothetical protein